MSAALKLVEPEVRRFGTADLTKHGGWILRRLLKLYPHISERYAAGWLRETVNSNTSLFLYLDHAVALFQVLSVHSLEPQPWIWERFVFVEEGYIAQGAEFYTLVATWAKNMGIERVVVLQHSDVPESLVKEKLGRLYVKQLMTAKV